MKGTAIITGVLGFAGAVAAAFITARIGSDGAGTATPVQSPVAAKNATSGTTATNATPVPAPVSSNPAVTEVSLDQAANSIAKGSKHKKKKK